MKPVTVFLRNHRDSFAKFMIFLTGITLPGAVLCYLFPPIQLYFFLLWRILLILGLFVSAVMFLAWQILGMRTKKSSTPIPARKTSVDFYKAIADFSDEEFEKFCVKINDPAIREAVKYDRELLRQ